YEQLCWWALSPRVPRRGAEARRLTARLRDGRPAKGAPEAGTRRGGTPDDRERVLAAALRLTAREEVALVSAVQIADEGNLPLEAFFELFADRDACLRAALADAGEPL